jgi:hypothetical protein
LRSKTEQKAEEAAVENQDGQAPDAAAAAAKQPSAPGGARANQVIIRKR